ncbi:hypothetical protein PR048_003187 [Dryococelus australis]|uniref:HAT C-terminal dimerisation domain-containing protein n=1 Tax=Dryococelus australis TaxID=614101 RepID=A0ABQ9INP5_9NEOP|nr:hypothetical protein PR048_003187 [Dryococelus australis]
MAEAALPEIIKILRIYLTYPVSSSTAERSFSALRRLKTFLRSTMTQPRLNHLLLLDIHKDKCDELNVEEMAEEFIETNNRRHSYFGSFYNY